MHTTRAFKNGNSQAVRIPADLAYERTDIELEIEREGDEIRIRPARRSLSGVLSKFAQVLSDFMAEGRGDQEQSRTGHSVMPRYMLDTNMCIYLMKNQPRKSPGASLSATSATW
jgi:antitoxin VapB